MRPKTVLAALTLAAILAGCAGVGVGGDCDLPADPAFAGQYAATYTPNGAGTGGREFRLSVTPDGRITGFVRDPAAGGAFETEVQGSVLNNPGGCGTNETLLDLNYTLPGGTPEGLNARKGITGSIAARFRVDASGGGERIGSLDLQRAIQTGG